MPARLGQLTFIDQIMKYAEPISISDCVQLNRTERSNSKQEWDGKLSLTS